MPTYSYRLVNVFTQNGGKLTGNPLCVFEDARGMDTQTMQALALQFNLSETTFILPSDLADAHVRIFTPRYEMPFAGHPTLGSAFVCHAMKGGERQLRLEMQAGIIPVNGQATQTGDRWTFDANAPTWRDMAVTKAQLADMLGLQASDIGDRPLWVNVGKEQLIVPLTSEDAVRRVRPDAARLATEKSRDGHCMAYVFTETAPGRTLARFFFPAGAALLEDPATGSATANFGGWLLAMGRALPQSLEISQGEYTGRASTLFLEVDSRKQIRVSGEVLELGRGEIRV
jgi:trans-2,3-dihydro-3-hydroxyanthranilate isomerase